MIERALRRLRDLAPPGPEEPAIAPLVECLRDEGILASCAPDEAGDPGIAHHPRDPGALVELLAGIGGANLSIGRLFEGHVNAAKLLALYATGASRDECLGAVARGELLGVWGADGAVPVRCGGGRLTGQKLFASGADVLDRAVISARDSEGAVQLFVIGCDRLHGRLFPDEWSVSGMKATASGRCDLDGLAVGPEDALGAPGDYHREPHFQGGVWRYAAVQVGAMRAMTAATASQIASRGQTEAPMQAARLRRMVEACETSRLWLEMAAREVEQPGAAPETAATAILARLTVEREAVELMQAMDAALGAASFATSHPVERRRRDLQVYLRQANPDGLGETGLSLLSATPQLARRWCLD